MTGRRAEGVRRVRWMVLVAVGLVSALTASSLAGQPGQPGQPGVRGVRAESAMRLDGEFAEADWARADSVTGLVQRDPQEGKPAGQRTVVRVLRDARGLWFAIEALDSEPGAIRRAQLRRDAELFTDDHVTLMLSPLNDRRSGFLFAVNPNGAIRDAEILDFENESREWDGVWDARARVTSRGWQAELFIPWATLRYRRDRGTWGFNVRRFVRRTNEESLWRAWRRTEGIRFLESAGTLDGMEGLPPRATAELRPYAATTANLATRAFDAAGPVLAASGRDSILAPATTVGDVGLDAKFAPTGSLTLDVTVNPDFAQAEVDRQIVNLTRFSLFFPEQRSFFTEGAGIYEFGRRQQTQLFYSRRIGLDRSGAPLPILGGARLSGRVAGHQVGALVVRTGGDAPGTDAVARIRHDILGRGYVGAMATLRDAGGKPATLAGGVDFNLPYVVNGQNLIVLGAVAVNLDSAGGRATTHARLTLDYPNDNADLNLRVDRVDAGYAPALGFVQQDGIWRIGGQTQWTPRPGRWGIRRLNFNFFGYDWVTRLDGTPSNGTFSVRPLGAETERGDRIELNLTRSFDRPLAPFAIFPGAVIAAGPYWWERVSATFNSTPRGRLGYDVTASTGDFYDGRSTELTGGLGLRLQPHLQGRLDVTRTEVTRAGGDFAATTLRLRTDYAVSPWVNLTVFTQYDNQSGRAAANARLRWTTRPGNDLFVVWNSTYAGQLPIGESLRRPQRGGLIIKYVGYLRV